VPYPKVGGNSLAGRRKQKVWRGLNGHEGESWIQPRRTWSRCLPYFGGQGVHREMESKGHEEKYRAVIDGDHPQDEPVGQRWGKVESALLGRRRSHSPTAPRCLRTARYRRTARDLRRTGRVSGWHRSKQTYKRKRSGERCFASSRTAK
jgi:hypothetical protein